MDRESILRILSDFLIEAKHFKDISNDTNDRNILGFYLSGVGYILAKVVQNLPISEEIDEIEHLFGNTWIKDEKIYEKLYNIWDKFKSILGKSLHGMTVNERLYELGLLEQFDKAVKSKNRNELNTILNKCLLDKNNISSIINDLV